MHSTLAGISGEGAPASGALPRYDVAVIGGGPAGLYATFYAGLRGMSVVLVEAAAQLGGQPALVYPDKWIYDVAGFPRIRGRELAEGLIEQAMRFQPDVRLNTRAEGLEDMGDGFYRLTLSDGTAVAARGVIVAAGLGAFEPKRLPAPGIERWEGRGLMYGVRRLDDLRDKRVVIVGGGDAAVDWALMAVEVAASVTLVHRRRQFRALEESVRALEQSPVRLELAAEVVGAEGGDVLERVHVLNKETGQTRVLECDVLVPCLGFKANLGALARWGFEVQGNEIVVDHSGATSLPRVYAIGDVARYPGKIKLIAVGFSEAAIAVSHLKAELDPGAALQPAHSSEMKLG
ncbi:MAG TPA: NAD(P)/FAD-dependent oxidoreductase [Thermaerobacter sp.]